MFQHSTVMAQWAEELLYLKTVKVFHANAVMTISVYINFVPVQTVPMSFK